MRKNYVRYFTPTADLLRKIGIYGGWLLVLLLIQSTLDPMGSGGRTIPALVLVAVSALGFFDSERVGAVAGIAAGWCLDAWSGGSLCILPLVGFAIGFFSGYAADRWIPRGILPFGVCLCGVGVVNMLCTLLGVLIEQPRPHFWPLVGRILLPELGLTLLWGAVVALVSRLLVKLQRRSLKLERSSSNGSTKTV